MLEKIGILAIAIFVIGIIILFVSHKESENKHEQRSRQSDIKNSSTLREFISNRESYVESGLEERDSRKLTREIDYLRSTDKIKKEIQKTIETKAKAKERVDKLDFDLKSLAFKYREDIFRIFGEIHDISDRELTNRTKYFYGLKSLKKSQAIIKEWMEGDLIEEIKHEDQTLYAIGFILDSVHYKLNQEEMTRSEWLEKQGLKLKPQSSAWEILKLKNKQALEKARKEEDERRRRNFEWM